MTNACNYSFLKKALIKAIDDYSTDILSDKRIINIIDDFQGYKDCPYVKTILLYFLEVGRLSYLYSIRNYKTTELEGMILHLVNQDSMRNGFSRTYLTDTYVAILCAFGSGNLFINKSNVPKELHDDLETAEKKLATETSDIFILNLSTIPFNMDYNKLGKLLCSKMNGVFGKEFECQGDKSVYFLAPLNGKAMIEFHVICNRNDNFAESILFFYEQSNTPLNLKSPYNELVSYLNKTYGVPSVKEAGDVEAYLDWLDYWKEDADIDLVYCIPLRAYILKEGTIVCYLRFSSSEFSLYVVMCPREREKQEWLKWRISKPTNFELYFPESQSDNTLEEEQSEFYEGSTYTFTYNDNSYTSSSDNHCILDLENKIIEERVGYEEDGFYMMDIDMRTPLTEVVSNLIARGFMLQKFTENTIAYLKGDFFVLNDSQLVVFPHGCGVNACIITYNSVSFEDLSVKFFEIRKMLYNSYGPCCEAFIECDDEYCDDKSFSRYNIESLGDEYLDIKKFLQYSFNTINLRWRVNNGSILTYCTTTEIRVDIAPDDEYFFYHGNM